MKSLDIRIWQVREKTPARTTKTGKKKPATYQLRWSVGGEPQARTFNSSALADTFRSRLSVAMQNGEPFDTETGLPDSLAEKPEQVTWFVFSARYMDMKWKSLSAKSRETTVYAVPTSIASLVSKTAGAPSTASLRQALQH